MTTPRGSAEHRLAEMTRDDRAMMLNPAWWPIQSPHPMLALKHRSITIDGSPHGLPRTGRLLPLNDGSYLLYQWKDDNPLEMEPVPMAFTTVDEVLAEGWVVD